MTSLCNLLGCQNDRDVESLYCKDHTYMMARLRPQTESIYDHLKINIEQSAKGARCTVTYDRSDHNIEKAVEDAILAYNMTIKNLKEQGMKVDEA